MADNEMLKNAVKALERKYLKNGFIAVNDEEALLSAFKLVELLKKRENKEYFLVIPANKLVGVSEIEGIYLLSDRHLKVMYMYNYNDNVILEWEGMNVKEYKWKKAKQQIITERPTVDKFKENSWDKIVALKKEGEEKRNQILAVGKKQIELILKKGER